MSIYKRGIEKNQRNPYLKERRGEKPKNQLRRNLISTGQDEALNMLIILV